MPNAGFTEAVQLLNLGILISGRGSNMKAILESVRGGKIPINPAVVISSSADAGGLETARKLGVDALVLDAKKYGQDRAQYDGMIAGELARRGVTPDNGLICPCWIYENPGQGICPQIPRKNFKHSSRTAAVFSRTARPEAGCRVRSQIFRLHSPFCRRRRGYGADTFARGRAGARQRHS